MKAAPEKLENSLQGEGRVRDTENTLLYRNFRCLCRKVYFFFRHLGRLSQRRLTGNSLSTRGAFQPSSPWRRKKNALQVCYGFYSCNLWYQNHFLEL